MTRKLLANCLIALTISISGAINAAQAQRVQEKKQEDTKQTDNKADKILLGKSLFMDSNLSEPAGQSCASCHSFGAGFADPDQNEATSRGIDPARFGPRNTPMASYTSFIPAFHYNEKEEVYVGGQFLDGRASTLEDQAKLPFFNELEMNNPDEETLVKKVKKSAYADLFTKTYGKNSLDDAKQALDHIADAIAAFERTDIFSPFTSKFDYVQAGKALFTDQEKMGMDLFKDKKKGNCAACHPTESDDGKAQFTDFTYDNLGAPKNLISPFNTVSKKLNPDGIGFVDKGLGSGDNKAVDPKHLKEQLGKFRVPSLRNVAITPPYTHNGVFGTLKEVVDFYNTRDVPGGKGHVKKPEVAENVNTEEMGDLKLTEQEVLAIVAFMETLTDGYQVEKKTKKSKSK